MTGNNTVKFNHPKKDFTRVEKPKFLVAIPYKSGSNIGKSKINSWKNADENIIVTVRNLITKTTVPAKIYKQASGKFLVRLQFPESKVWMATLPSHF